MPTRALLLSSILLLAGCGAAASSSPMPGGGGFKSAERKPDGSLGGEGHTRSLVIDPPADETKPPPEKIFDVAPGGPTPGSSSHLVGLGAPEPEKKPLDSDKATAPSKNTSLRAAVVDSGTPLGNGRLTQPQIAKIIEQGGDIFGECYSLGAGGANKDFRATVTVKATIGPTGKVNVAEVTKSTANNPKVDACVAQAFKRVNFPTPADGATSVITFPITFNGLEVVN